MRPVESSYPGPRPDPWREPQGPHRSGDDGTPPWLAERLFDRRVIMLAGSLTGPVASQTAAALLTLDAMGTEPVQLHLSAPDGDLSAAFTIVDAIDALRAPVHVVVTAEA